MAEGKQAGAHTDRQTCRHTSRKTQKRVMQATTGQAGRQICRERNGPGRPENQSKLKPWLKNKTKEARDKLDEIDKLIAEFIESKESTSEVNEQPANSKVRDEGFLTSAAIRSSQRQHSDGSAMSVSGASNTVAETAGLKPKEAELEAHLISLRDSCRGKGIETK